MKNLLFRLRYFWPKVSLPLFKLLSFLCLMVQMTLHCFLQVYVVWIRGSVSHTLVGLLACFNHLNPCLTQSTFHFFLLTQPTSLEIVSYYIPVLFVRVHLHSLLNSKPSKFLRLKKYEQWYMWPWNYSIIRLFLLGICYRGLNI